MLRQLLTSNLWYRHGLKLAVVLCCLLAVYSGINLKANAATGINETLNYQGRLLTNTGAVVADGTYNMEFKIVKGGDGCNPTSNIFPCSGTTQWTETRETSNKVLVRNGYFSVYLGSVTAFGSSVDWNDDTLWLAINVGGTGAASYDGVMKPLTRLSSSPYALNSGRLNGLTSLNFTQLAQGLQVDSSTTNASIAINKTGATANIFQLQRGGLDVVTVNNTGLLTTGEGLTVTTGKNFTINGESFTDLTGNGLTISSNALTLNLQAAADGLSAVTSSGSGLQVLSGGLSLMQGCSDGQVLAWIEASDVWACSTASGGAGTLQASYDTASGNTIATPSTGSARDLSITLTDSSGTDSNFLVNIANNSSSKAAIQYNGTDVFRINATDGGTGRGTALFQNQANSTTAFQIQNAGGTPVLTADTTNSQLSVRGINSVATLGAEKVTNGTFTGNATGWTLGTGWAYATNNVTKTAGTASSLEQNITAVNGESYQTVFSITSWTAGCLTPEVGGITGQPICAVSTQTQIITATGTGNFKLNADSSFAGTVDTISVQRITSSNSALRVVNSDNTTGLEVRSGGSGLNNSFVGLQSGANNTTGYDNSALGSNALTKNTTGYENSAIGIRALENNTIGVENSALGSRALQNNTTGSGNSALGVRALQFNNTGFDNIAVGNFALQFNTTGSYNAAFGKYSINSNITGSNNSALGNSALRYNTTGGSNSALGANALVFTTGSGNSALGTRALESNNTGANNSALGYHAGYQDPNKTAFATLSNLQNATAIGYGSQVQLSNALVLGSVGTVASNLTPNVGIGTTSPTNLFSISPNVYDTGTASTSASATVNGVGTTWTANMIGNEFVFANGNKYTITGWTSTTQMTLSASSTNSSQAYRVHNKAFYVSNTGSASLRNSTDSTSAFQVQEAAGTNTETLFNVDTTNRRVTVGTGADATKGTVLVLDNIPAANLPTASAAINGAMVYDNTNNKFKCVVNSVWVDCDTGGGGGGDLDGAYDADANKTLDIDSVSGLVFNMTTTGDFIIQDNGTPVFTVNDSGNVSIRSSVDSSTALLIEDSGGRMGLAFDTTNSHLKIYEDTLTPTNYVDIYYDNATSTAVFAASSGTTKIGSGSGPVTINAGTGSQVTITGHANSTISTTAGALTITSAAAATWSTSSGQALTLQSGSGTLSLGTTSGLTADGALAVSTAANGALTLSPNGTGDIVLSLDDDSMLLGTGTMTNTGALADFNITLGNDADIDTVAALKVDATSANTGDADILYGLQIGNLLSADATVRETGLQIGSGWDTALEANGNILIGAQTANTPHTFASGCACSATSAAGTFGAQTLRDGATASVVYKGKLFVAVSETDAAGVYRYDGGTTWTLVTNAIGKAVTGDTANIDDYSVTVFNGSLYIGSKTAASTGALYSSTTAHTTADSFTLVNTTRGTFATAGQDGIMDMAVWNGQLFISTQEPNLAEIVRWDGGSVFSQVTATDGKSVAETVADKDGFLLTVFNNTLYSGSISGSTTAIVAAYQGNGTTWVHLHGTTGGGALGAETAYIDITSMSVWNGALYVAGSKANAAAVYRYKSSQPVANVPANFQRMTTTVGKLIAGDTQNIDAIVLRNYDGRLYAGSQTATAEDTAALYEYPGSGTEWTLINGTRGTFGATTAVNSISNMIVVGDSLYVGTTEPNAASSYTWSKIDEDSFELKFDSGNSNYGSLSFSGNKQLSDNSGHYGTFNFSNGITTGGGAFDYAEDFPTLDSTLAAGQPVTVDAEHPEHVRLARIGEPVIGVVSANPGMRLSSNVPPASGGRWVPIALIGRVPVNVTTHGGQTPIKAGDTLALSALSGVLEKAGPGSGAIVGVALAGYSSSEPGTVSLYVSPQIGGQTHDFNMTELKAGLDINAETLTLMPSTTEAANAFDVKDQFGTKSVEIDNQGNAYFKGTITADKIKANQIEGLEIFITKPSTIAPGETTSSQPMKTQDGIVTASKNNDSTFEINGVSVEVLTVNTDLTVKGMLFASGGLKVDGPADFYDDATFHKATTFVGTPTFNKDTAGYALIRVDENEVEVKFEKAYKETPIVSLSIKNGVFASFAYKDLTKDGFKIVLSEAATSDVEFSWTALAVKDAKTAKNPEPIKSEE